MATGDSRSPVGLKEKAEAALSRTGFDKWSRDEALTGLMNKGEKEAEAFIDDLNAYFDACDAAVAELEGAADIEDGGPAAMPGLAVAASDRDAIVAAPTGQGEDDGLGLIEDVATPQDLRQPPSLRLADRVANAFAVALRNRLPRFTAALESNLANRLGDMAMGPFDWQRWRDVERFHADRILQNQNFLKHIDEAMYESSADILKNVLASATREDQGGRGAMLASGNRTAPDMRRPTWLADPHRPNTAEALLGLGYMEDLCRRWDTDDIVAINAGGQILKDYLGCRLNRGWSKRLILSFQAGAFQKGCLEAVSAELGGRRFKDGPRKRVLVVDDVTRTGRTVRCVGEALAGLSANVEFVYVCLVSTGASETQLSPPDVVSPLHSPDVDVQMHWGTRSGGVRYDGRTYEIGPPEDCFRLSREMADSMQADIRR